MKSAKTTYDQRLRRINDSIALKEPDIVPLNIVIQCYPFIHAGYTMADILYDTDFSKARHSMFNFLDEYQPDYIFGQAYVHIGEGPMLELARPKTLRWAGMPGNIIDKNSVHQFIEFPILQDDEFEEFMRDRTWWIMKKAMPRTTALLEPMANWNIMGNTLFGGHQVMAQMLCNPETKQMIDTLWKINEMSTALQAHTRQLDIDIEEAGFPTPMQGFSAVPYDNYSDTYRGTIDAMIDMMERPDYVLQYCREDLEATKALIRWQASLMPGRHVFMPLHKGMDSFMNPEQYRKFYWRDLQEIISTIIDAGMVPYIYTEGKYDSRLECLKEVPKGKVLYHFEEVDMIRAKKILGDTACISGGFPVYLLDFGTKQQVIDEAKRLIDGCAAGGGFIFETSCGIDYAKPENVEALVETVRTYGKS
ncbi:MAG: uroporphyrinogen decarboxylase family protein [Oscillospiraceae bacterium]